MNLDIAKNPLSIYLSIYLAIDLSIHTRIDCCKPYYHNIHKHRESLDPGREYI